jgi:hypothetical protein
MKNAFNMIRHFVYATAKACCVVRGKAITAITFVYFVFVDVDVDGRKLQENSRVESVHWRHECFHSFLGVPLSCDAYTSLGNPYLTSPMPFRTYTDFASRPGLVLDSFEKAVQARQ